MLSVGLVVLVPDSTAVDNRTVLDTDHTDMPKLEEPRFFENVLNGHGPDMNRSISTKALLHLLDFLTDGRYEKDMKNSDGYAELKRSFRSKKSANLQQSLNKFAGLVEELVDEHEEEARDYFREKEQYLKNIIEGLYRDVPSEKKATSTK